MLSREQLDIILSARDQSAAAFNTFRGRLNTVNRDLSFLKSTLLGVVGVTGALSLARMIGNVVSESSGLVKTAERVGLTVEQLQELHHAADLADVEIADFDKSMEQFTKRLGEAAQGTGKLKEILQANNVPLRDQNGNMISAQQQLLNYADLMKNAANENDRMVLATTAFGKAGMGMVNVLSQGSQGLRENQEEARRLGIVLSGDTMKAAEELNDNWSRFTSIIDTEFKRAVLDVVTGMNGANGEMEDFAHTIGDVFKLIGDNIGLIERFASAILLMKIGGLAGKKGAAIGFVAGAVGPDVMDLMNGKLPWGLSDDETLPNPSGIDPSAPGIGAIDPNAPSPLPRPDGLGRPPRRTVMPPGGGMGGGGADRNRTAEVLQQLRLEGEQLTLNVEKRREAEQLETEINMLRRAGTGASAAEQDQIRAAVAALYEKKQAFEDLKREVDNYNDALRMSGDLVVDALDSIIFKGDKAVDVLKNMVTQLGKAALQAAVMGDGPLAGILGLKGTNGGLGGVMGLISSAFNPGRAEGGDVYANSPVWVGEKGRKELFVPDRPGTIYTEDQLRGMSQQSGGSMMVHAPVTIVAKDIESFRRSSGEVSRTIGNAVKRAQRVM